MNRGSVCFSIMDANGMFFLRLGKINKGTKQNEGQRNKIDINIKNSAIRTFTSPAANIKMKCGGIYNEANSPNSHRVCMNKERGKVACQFSLSFC